MIRILRVLPFVVVAGWAAVLVGRGALRTPERIGALGEPRRPLAAIRAADPYYGEFHAFLDAVEPLVPRDAPTVLIGPAVREWPGHRANYYKLFRFRMTPRPIRPARQWDDLPALYAWADTIVIFRSTEPQELPGAFALVATLADGRIYRRRTAIR